MRAALLLVLALAAQRASAAWDGDLPLHSRTLSNMRRKFQTQAPPRECGSGAAVWTDALVDHELALALHRLAVTPLSLEPFRHLDVDPLFSRCFYRALMQELPPSSHYTPRKYPGTLAKYDLLGFKNTAYFGREASAKRPLRIPEDCCSRRTAASGRSSCECFSHAEQLHSLNHTLGLTLSIDQLPERFPMWTQAFRFVHSHNFTRLLVDRFSVDGGIPKWKLEGVVRPACENNELRNTAGLRIEPNVYDLTPHIDVHQKIITWQYFHPSSEELRHRRMGTFFYRPKAGRRLQMNDRKNPSWLDWRFFDEAVEMTATPNHFFAFAPSPHPGTFHGAKIAEEQLEGVADRDARRTFLGFIMSLKNATHFYTEEDSPDPYYI